MMQRKLAEKQAAIKAMYDADVARVQETFREQARVAEVSRSNGYECGESLRREAMAKADAMYGRLMNQATVGRDDALAGLKEKLDREMEQAKQDIEGEISREPWKAKIP